MRALYLITAYKNPAQVAAQVRALAAAAVGFIVHLDRKSGPEIETELRRALGDVEGVHFLPRQNVYWAGFSVVEVALRAIAYIDEAGLDPDQFVLLSGQDFPIKPAETIATRLAADPDTAYVKYFELPDWQWLPNERGGLDRFERIYVRDPRGGMIKLPFRRRVIRSYRPYGGSANCSLGRPHRRYLREEITRDPAVTRYFRHANVADEIFFQTMLLNSPLRDSVVNDDLLYSRWLPGANHPELIGEGDIDALQASKTFFARKFDVTVAPEAIEAVSQQLLSG